VAASLGMQNQNIFSLTITVGSTVETIKNLTLVDSARRYDRVLAGESSFVRAPATLTTLTDARTLVDPTSKLSDPSTASVGSSTHPADGAPLQVGDYVTDTTTKRGVQALEKTDLFNLLCLPPDTRPDSWGDTAPGVYQGALQYCVQRRAMLVVDSPTTMTSVAQAQATLATLGLSGIAARNAVLYYPRVLEADPLRGGKQDTFVPCGIVSGIMAQTDAQRGVWKAPAGIDAGLLGIQGLKDNMTDLDNAQINPLGINALRTFPVVGTVVWGARTLRGADQLADDYKYLPVRRTALFLEESLVRGTRFAVFEPNDEPLWAQLRMTIGAFLNNLFRQGAFQGQSAREAYFVKVDKETTTQNDINLGVVNILVGFAPLKPAEFVVIKLQQIAGQVAA